MTPEPPITPLSELPSRLRAAGWAVLSAGDLAPAAATPIAAFEAWKPVWSDLPPDPHLLDGGRYRRRRHGCYEVGAGLVAVVPHRAHWQPVEYNALHGGIERWFEPLPATLTEDPAWPRLLLALSAMAETLHGPCTWFAEAHAFRIDTAGGIGRPTPEGAHRDGVDLVAVILVDRHGVKGGETRVFDMAGPQGVRFTLAQPWSVLLLDDARVIHETTPIQPLHPPAEGWRDTLVVTLRRHGFQGPAADESGASLRLAAEGTNGPASEAGSLR